MIGLGRLYSLVFDAVSIAAAQDIFYIKPAADKVCVVEAIYLSNVGGTADAGDAQEELLRILIDRLPSVVTVGSGGVASTVATLGPVEVNDTAASFTGRTNDTVLATSTGIVRVIHSDGWNVRIPYIWNPPPEHRIMVSNPEAIVFRLPSAPADAVTCSGTIYVRELP